MPSTNSSGASLSRLPRPPSTHKVSLWLALAAGFYIVYALYTGHDKLQQALQTLGWQGPIIVLLCALGNYLFRFIRWQYYLGRFGFRIPLVRHLGYYIAGFALTTTPGKAGETVRSLYLKSHDVPYSTSLSVFFTERFLDVLTLALFSLLALLVLQGLNFLLLAVGLLVLFLFTVMRSNSLIQRLSRRMLHILPARLFKLWQNLAAFLHAARRLFQPAPVSIGLLLGIVAWALQGTAFFYVLAALGVPLAYSTALAIYAIGILGGALSMIPGGIGATEASMAALLLSVGASTDVSLVAPFLIRIGTLWFAVLLGFICSALLGFSSEPVTATQIADQNDA